MTAMLRKTRHPSLLRRSGTSMAWTSEPSRAYMMCPSHPLGGAGDVDVVGGGAEEGGGGGETVKRTMTDGMTLGQGGEKRCRITPTDLPTILNMEEGI